MPFAEEINYWKTSSSSPDTWIERTISLIKSLGGTVKLESYGNEPATGRAAFLVIFEIKGEQFKILWPVLPSKTKNERATKIQAATLLYHDTKAKCLKASVFGVRTAFFEYLLLPDGRTTTEVSAPEVMTLTPVMFSSNSTPQIKPGEYMNAEFSEVK